MDEIRIDGLKIYGYHGVYPEEEAKGQNFILSLRLFLCLQEAGLTDDLALSISYEEVCLFVKEVFSEKRFSLIEALAEHLSCRLFAKYPKLEELALTVSKPEAPIDADFSNVSVCIRRKRHLVYLAYGANEGDALRQIKDGLQMIADDPFCELLAATEPERSTPYGGVEQPDFYNGAAKIRTLYGPHDLLRFLHKVEEAQGLDRSKKTHWGPRPLDLDILFYDDLVLAGPELVIPHPDIQNRDFVLEPLVKLEPQLLHPVLKKTAAELAAEVKEKHLV
ncbi:MAG: 2-amino-4-hydroxy-6-hydroxymethyldihydropteridine diphosphokinase [Lachnospiraceae bacterium]|nr:2-amino-4-hydroxy-6-hydroxymethyldihydropteridine diphosphokinase [Lachnospiraceae bacterium]